MNLGHRLWPSFDYRWLVEEMKRNLPQELDFSHEARNSERCRACLRTDPDTLQVVVPDVVWKFTTREVSARVVMCVP